MAVDVDHVIGMLHELPLLTPAQGKELEALRRKKDLDGGELTRMLLTRGWLTSYQADLLLAGRGRELRLGPYLLLEPLGQGGMGHVFRARHTFMDRLVALKLIRPDLLNAQHSVQRFRREIEAAAKLSHANIITVHDAAEVDGRHFFVMELVDGIDLAELVQQRGPLSVPLACDYVRQAALGLQHAHEHGLVHRDLKPANLLLNRQGVVKILDLGIARIRALEGETAETGGLTQEGMVLGTPDYMAPEQAADPHAADIRADIYSLGCTLFFLLTGQPPFPGGTLTQKIARHLTQSPPGLPQVRPDVPPALAVIVQKMLAKQPQDRYQSPVEAARALDGLGQTPAPPATWDLPLQAKPDQEVNTAIDFQTTTQGGGRLVQRRSRRRALPPPLPQQRRTRRWPLIAVAAGLALLVVVVIVVVGRRPLPEPDPQPLPEAAAAAAPPPVDPRARITYQLNPYMGFGLALRDRTGEFQRLTFSNKGYTNHILVRLDDDQIHFGTSVGKWEQRAAALAPAPDGRPHIGHRGTWLLKDVACTSTLEIVSGKRPGPIAQTGELDTCLITYEFENRGKEPRKVGLRLFLDCHLGKAREQVFTAAGKKELIEQPLEFRRPEDVPAHIYTSEKGRDGLDAYLTLKVGGEVEPPSRFSIGHWTVTLSLPWNVPLGTRLNDAAVTLYWDAVPLPPGGKRTIGFAYGGSVYSLK